MLDSDLVKLVKEREDLLARLADRMDTIHAAENSNVEAKGEFNRVVEFNCGLIEHAQQAARELEVKLQGIDDLLSKKLNLRGSPSVLDSDRVRYVRA